MTVATAAAQGCLQGSLDDFPVDEVLHFLDAAGRPGRLVVEGSLPADLLVGSSTLGCPTAGVDRAAIVERLFHLLLVGDGPFTFTPGDDVDVTAGWPLDGMVEEVRARADRWRVLSQALPSLDVVVRLLPRREAASVTLPAGTWDVVVAVDGVRSVRAVALEVGADAFTTMEAVHFLLEHDLAAVVAADTL